VGNHESKSNKMRILVVLSQLVSSFKKINRLKVVYVCLCLTLISSSFVISKVAVATRQSIYISALNWFQKAEVLGAKDKRNSVIGKSTNPNDSKDATKISYSELSSAIDVEQDKMIGSDNLKAKLTSNQSYLEFKDGDQSYSIISTLLNSEKNKLNSKKQREKIAWDDVQPDVSIENALYENKLKETLTVKKAKSDAKFQYTIELSNAAVLVQKDNKTLIVDKDGKELVELDAPFAVDASNTRFDYKYSIDGNKLTMEPAADISAALYPLVIDPTYTIKTTVNATNWNYYGSQRKLARDGNGNLHTVYVRVTGGYNNVFYAKSYDGGQSWFETALTSDTAYAQNRPSIAIDSANNVHVVWDGTDVTNAPYVFPHYRKFTSSSGSWGTTVNLPGGSSASIAVD